MSLLTISSNIWTEILDFCSNQDITNLLKASKLFWNIDIRNYALYVLYFSDIDQNSICYQKITYLYIKIFDFKNVESLIIPPNLKEIYFNSSEQDNDNFYNDIYDNYLSKIKTLTSLSILNINNIKNIPEKLTYLELNNCYCYFSSLPKTLKTLDLFYVIENIYLKFLSNHITLPENLNLEELIIDCYSLPQIFLILDNLPSNLKFLNCGNSRLPKQLPEKLEKLILKYLIDLSDLDESSLKNIKKLVIKSEFNEIKNKEILSNFNQLEELDIDAEWTKIIPISKTLKRLTISFEKYFLDFNINYFDLDNLEYLSLNNKVNATIILINISSKNLTELTLNGCFDLEEKDVNLPNLKIIRLEEKFEGDIEFSDSVIIINNKSKEVEEENNEELEEESEDEEEF